jgi:hypothetical protein
MITARPRRPQPVRCGHGATPTGADTLSDIWTIEPLDEPEEAGPGRAVPARERGPADLVLGRGPWPCPNAARRQFEFRSFTLGTSDQ